MKMNVKFHIYYIYSNGVYYKRATGSGVWLGTYAIWEDIFRKEKNPRKIYLENLTLLYSFICNKKAVKTKWFKSHLENKN